MTGFIRGLFRGGNKQQRPPKPQQGGAFFLDEDEAKTYGDIDYMRSSKVVKRTFARKKGQTEELKSVRSISAMEMGEVDEKGLPTQQPTSQQQPMSQQPTRSFENPFEKPKFERRKPNDTDSDMDMFRNMARDIKKK